MHGTALRHLLEATVKETEDNCFKNRENITFSTHSAKCNMVLYIK